MPDTAAGIATDQSPLQSSLWTAALVSLTLLLIFHVTSWSMVAIWMRSETFAHGFLVLPISLWLAWNQRDRLREISPRPAPWVALLMLPVGFGWLLATLVDVQVIQQLALVAMLVVGVWAILGHQLAWALAFPLLFLFLAVPMGEALVPPMMEFTATSTVWLIQQTGVPVYREGLYFTLPSGNWSVVEACSGVRYIIASVTLGLLYAYLTYRSLRRRMLFILASAIVPIFANTMRAYIIVMLGHWSDMTVATGVDHLIYGWVFFGLVMFVLFWLGSFFREDQEHSPGATPADTGQPVSFSSSKLIATALAALIAAALWPWLAHTAQSRPGSVQATVITPPAPAGAWSEANEVPWQWQPVSAVNGHTAAYYRRDGQTLGLIMQYPETGTASGEVVGSSTWFTDADSAARVIAQERHEVQIDSQRVVVDQAQVVGVTGQLLSWSWYRIGDLHTSNDYVAKFSEALGALGLADPGAFRIILVLPIEGSVSVTQAVMQDFLLEHGSQLGKELEHTAVDVD